MVRFPYVAICALLLIAGCVANSALGDSAMADNNISNLTRISLGMKESQVLKLMHAPYKQESYRVGCDRYHVWFYVTNVTGLGQSRMVPMNMTPLTFRNCRLVGVGYSYYRWLRELKKPFRRSSFSEEKDIENKQLERTLEQSLGPSSKGKVPSQNLPTKVGESPPVDTAPHPPQKNNKLPSNTQPPQNPQGGQSKPKSRSNPPTKPSDEQEDPSNLHNEDNFPHNYPGSPTSVNEQFNNTSDLLSQGMLSMSTVPKQTPAKENEPDPSGKPEWNEEDEQQIEEESEQNFNFW